MEKDIYVLVCFEGDICKVLYPQKVFSCNTKESWYDIGNGCRFGGVEVSFITDYKDLQEAITKLNLQQFDKVMVCKLHDTVKQGIISL